MTSPATLDPVRRPLTRPERRLLGARIRSFTARSRRASRGFVPITGGVVLLLWLWTLLASDVHWAIITAFWLVVGGAIAVWVGRDLRRDRGSLDVMARGLASALRRNAADVYDIRATRFAEMEEIEDEGACYAFELTDNLVVFVTGQEFYARARFPSLDFSLVYPLDEGGRSVDMLINKRGAKAVPAKTIPAAVKRRIEVPEHLEIRAGSIADLEGCLGPSSTERF